MGQEVETFVRLSIRYQILIAQEVAKNTGKRVYVFDSTKLFQNEPTTEIVGNVNTLVKDGLRAVISIAVEESFGSNTQLFLEYVDQGFLIEDEIGLFVSPTVPQIKLLPVATTQKLKTEEDNEESEEESEEETKEEETDKDNEESEEETEETEETEEEETDDDENVQMLKSVKEEDEESTEEIKLVNALTDIKVVN